MSQPISAPQARRVSRRWPLISGGTAVAAALVLGLIVSLRRGPNEFDGEWLEEIVEHRSPLWDVPAYVMNFVGGGWFGVTLSKVSATTRTTGLDAAAARTSSSRSPTIARVTAPAA